MTEDWEITTGDGGVSLYLPSDFGAELDAHTGDGTIRNDLGLESAARRSVATHGQGRRTLRGSSSAPAASACASRTGDGSID